MKYQRSTGMIWRSYHWGSKDFSIYNSVQYSTDYYNDDSIGYIIYYSIDFTREFSIYYYILQYNNTKLYTAV